jgi:hypothetical protein
MLHLILASVVWGACAVTGICPYTPKRPIPVDISPDPVPVKPHR